MLILGIETSGLSGSVAIHRDGSCLASRSLEQPGRRHAQSLVLELRELLLNYQCTPRDVDAIAVSRGPGSFTGLRVGMVCAKTFAYATGCQFVAVDTFAAVAANCPPEISDVWIVEDAQRGDLFVGEYRRNESADWRQLAPIAVANAETWLAQRSEDETIVGRGLLRCDPSLITKARCLTNSEMIQPRAAEIANCGERMLRDRVSRHQQGSLSPSVSLQASAEPIEATASRNFSPTSSTEEEFDFWRSLPFYIRPSAAEEQRDKRDAAEAAR